MSPIVDNLIILSGILIWFATYAILYYVCFYKSYKEEVECKNKRK